LKSYLVFKNILRTLLYIYIFFLKISELKKNERVYKVEGIYKSLMIFYFQMVTGEDILEYEFSVVHCVELPMKRGIYETGYARIVPVAQELSEKSQKAAKDGRLNVVVLVFESMSRLNFIRQLPKTHAFINEKLGGVVMEGLTKVTIYIC